jgi:NAD(P)-dependent dehydrogenase (short-subunit alcohol dehydrogenase family)
MDASGTCHRSPHATTAQRRFGMSFESPFSLHDTRILVTGATSGIGQATALLCASMGATVVGAGRNPERLAHLHTQLEAAAAAESPHQVIQADLTDATQREALIAQLPGPLHGVVHSAGVSRLSPLRQVQEAQLLELQQINVNAPMLLTRSLLTRNLVARNGSIVFLASIAAHVAVPGVSVYSGTKAALLAMSRCLALEVVKHGIRVNCLSPALVETPMLDPIAKIAGGLDAERSKYPLGLGKPDDVANAAVFLLSNASRWITGTTIVMGGGSTAI